MLYHTCYFIRKRCTLIRISQFCKTKLNCPKKDVFFFFGGKILLLPTFLCLHFLFSRGFDGFMSKSHAMAKNSGTLRRQGCPCRTLKFHGAGVAGFQRAEIVDTVVTDVSGGFQNALLESKIGWNSNMLSHYLSTMAFRFRILGIILPGSFSVRPPKIVFFQKEINSNSCF